MSESMLGGFFAVTVKAEHRNAFVEASAMEAKGVIAGEPGVFQFQILVDVANPNRFYFFEIYEDEAAGKSHMDSDTFKAWKKSVEHMLETEVETIAVMHTLFPSISGLRAQKAGLSTW